MFGYCLPCTTDWLTLWTPLTTLSLAVSTSGSGHRAYTWLAIPVPKKFWKLPEIKQNTDVQMTARGS